MRAFSVASALPIPYLALARATDRLASAEQPSAASARNGTVLPCDDSLLDETGEIENKNPRQILKTCRGIMWCSKKIKA